MNDGGGVMIQVGTLIMYLIQAIILVLMILLIRMFRNGGKDSNGKRINPNPGYGTKCIEHEGMIVKHETSIGYIVKTLEADQKSINALNNKIDTGFNHINALIQKALRVKA